MRKKMEVVREQRESKKELLPKLQVLTKRMLFAHACLLFDVMKRLP